MNTRSFLTMVAVLSLVGAAATPTSAQVASPSDATSGPVIQAGGFDLTRPELVATGMQIPWGLAFLPDGSALVSERSTARIFRLRPGVAPALVTTVPGVVPAGESGLLGLAVSPTFASDNLVYAYLHRERRQPHHPVPAGHPGHDHGGPLRYPQGEHP